MRLDLVDQPEIARRAGVRLETVYQWRQRHEDFPVPDAALRIGPLWIWSRVEAWLEETGRLGEHNYGRRLPPNA